MASILPKGPARFNVFNDTAERELPPISSLTGGLPPSRHFPSINNNSNNNHNSSKHLHYQQQAIDNSLPQLRLASPPAFTQNAPSTPETTPTATPVSTPTTPDAPASWTPPSTIARMSLAEFVDFMFPEQTNRKPMHSSASGRRRGQTDYKDPKHAELEKFRRGRLTNLFKAVGTALPDHFVELAGWKADKSQPESKEQVMQAEKYWRDTIKMFLTSLAQETEGSRRLPSTNKALEDMLQSNDEKAKMEMKALNLERENSMLIGRVSKLEKDYNASEFGKCEEINILNLEIRSLKQHNFALEDQLRRGSAPAYIQEQGSYSPPSRYRKRGPETNPGAGDYARISAKRPSYETLPSLSTQFSPPSPASIDQRRGSLATSFSSAHTLSPIMSPPEHLASRHYQPHRHALSASQMAHPHNHSLPCSPPFSGRTSPECPQ